MQYTISVTFMLAEIYFVKILAYLQAGKKKNTFKPPLTVLLLRNFTNFAKVNNLMINLMLLKSAIVLRKQ